MGDTHIQRRLAILGRFEELFKKTYGDMKIHNGFTKLLILLFGVLLLSGESVQAARLKDIAEPRDYAAAFRQLLTSPNLCSRRWVYEQYDHFVGGGTVVHPGADAAVVRLPRSSLIRNPSARSRHLNAKALDSFVLEMALPFIKSGSTAH